MDGLNPQTDILKRLERHGVVPVVRSGSPGAARQAVDILYEAGFRTFEITMTVPGAPTLIGELGARPDVLVGAGTVMSLADAEHCLEQGARYLVSPVIVAGLPECCRQQGALCIMSGLTPAEVLRAHQAGADAVKIFPASSVGGPHHLRALKTVLPEVPMVPTGGVTLDNLEAYRQAGAAFVGVGGDLVNGRLLPPRELEASVRRARQFLEAARSPQTESLAKPNHSTEEA